MVWDLRYCTFVNLEQGEETNFANPLTCPSSTHNNPGAKHMLATLTGEGEASQGAAADYVREIFDELSEEFEDKLVRCGRFVANVTRPPRGSPTLIRRVLPLISPGYPEPGQSFGVSGPMAVAASGG